MAVAAISVDSLDLGLQPRRILASQRFRGGRDHRKTGDSDDDGGQEREVRSSHDDSTSQKGASKSVGRDLLTVKRQVSGSSAPTADWQADGWRGSAGGRGAATEAF